MGMWVLMCRHGGCFEVGYPKGDCKPATPYICPLARDVKYGQYKGVPFGVETGIIACVYFDNILYLGFKGRDACCQRS